MILFWSQLASQSQQCWLKIICPSLFILPWPDKTWLKACALFIPSFPRQQVHVYIYIHIYIYIYTYIITCYIFFFLFSALAENLKEKRVFGWLCLILIKSCFNSQDKHLRLQLFHVLFYQIMVNQATNSSNLVYNFSHNVFQLFPPFLHSFGRPPQACGAHFVGF